MRRVLMIGYYFPPLGGIGSLRMLKFARYLPQYGWEPTVIAPRNGSYHRDPSLSFPEDRVVRTDSLELSRLGKRAFAPGFSDTQTASVGPWLHRLQDAVRRWVYRPDAQIGWYPFAVAAGRRTLREQRFDAIFSSSFPITSHLVARRLHRDTALPWLAEFRDPFGDLKEIRDRRNQALEDLEGAIAREADGVVAPSPDWGRRLGEKGARRVSVITNGYDPLDILAAGVLPPAGAGFTLTHVGSLYPERQDLSAVWPALAAVRTSGEIPALTLRFVGDLAPALRREIEATGLGGSLEVTGFLRHADAVAAMMRSSALLIAGSRDGRSGLRGFIPAKVFEYLGSGLPIIHIGNPGSDAGALLQRYPGCHVVDAGDVDGVARALVAASREGRVERLLTGLTRQELTLRLAESLAAVCP